MGLKSSEHIGKIIVDPRNPAFQRLDPRKLEIDDLALLERGAARIFGTLMLAGAEAEQTGVPADEEALLAKFSPAETESLLTLMTDPAYRPLRVVAGIDGGFDANQSAAENEEKGEQMGMDLATRIMMAALDTCGVKPERLR